MRCSVAKAIVDAAMVRICGALAKASLGWKGLQEKLLRMDMDGSGRVKLEEVQLAFAFVGIKISSAEGDALEARFGTTQPRVLNVRELLKHLRQASAEGI
jgi:Ca2+-binding EF-hand superfamily protein